GGAVNPGPPSLLCGGAFRRSGLGGLDVEGQRLGRSVLGASVLGASVLAACVWLPASWQLAPWRRPGGSGRLDAACPPSAGGLREEAIEGPFPIEPREIVVTAEGFSVDEDLRDGVAARRLAEPGA